MLQRAKGNKCSQALEKSQKWQWDGHRTLVWLSIRTSSMNTNLRKVRNNFQRQSINFSKQWETPPPVLYGSNVREQSALGDSPSPLREAPYTMEPIRKLGNLLHTYNHHIEKQLQIKSHCLLNELIPGKDFHSVGMPLPTAQPSKDECTKIHPQRKGGGWRGGVQPTMGLKIISNKPQGKERHYYSSVSVQGRGTSWGRKHLGTSKEKDLQRLKNPKNT